ncbi:MAG: MFS transporter [Eubacteriales bacterium]|nr:MFS transporter [Eubacteriales bacterium]
MRRLLRGVRPEMGLFFFVIAMVSLGLGLSDGIFANYFKDAYHVTAVQRGFIEFPRELPGLLCALLIAGCSFMGDVRSALIAQVLSILGLTVLGLLTPPFGVMLIFLFINSLGMHMFMPLQDAIGMKLAEPDRVGKRMGQYNSVRSAFGFLASIFVFFGFRTGFLSFTTPIKWVFLAGVTAFVAALIGVVALSRRVQHKAGKPQKIKLVFRKEYKFYYLLTMLHGVQKQIAYVYGSWVIIDILLKKADTTAILAITCSFIGIFFMNALGRWMDRFGVKKMMYTAALTFVGVYTLYGFTVMGITSGNLPGHGWPVFAIYGLFVLDRMSMQMSMVNAVYLRSIAFEPAEVTATLSMGTSLDHVVSILAAIAGGFIWSGLGSHWVFFLAAAFSLGNVVIASLVRPDDERRRAQIYRAQRGIDMAL